ncbi:MAG: carboxypeptidase regulatory-like domain-containing protein [Chloroflexi bacterium]|nr:carboxypeptidase regulatory-like domain-containing protein [Chloroflexota bacterium]
MPNPSGRARRHHLVIVLSLLMVVAGAVLLTSSSLLSSSLLIGEREVEGIVLDRLTGQPLANVAVAAAGQTTLTDQHGHFSVGGVRPGLTVQLDLDGYRPTSVVLGFDRSVQATLDPYLLSGIVADAATGQPVADATITVANRKLTTGLDGRFNLSAVKPGREGVAEASGYSPARFTLGVDDADSPVAIALQPTTLTLRIVDAWTGNPVAGATVELEGQARPVGDTGEVGLERVRHGVGLTIRAPGFSPADLTFQGQADLRVELRPDAVTGSVVDKQGKPVAGARVSAGTVGTTTDDTGHYRLAGLPSDATLTVRKLGYAPIQVEVRQQSRLDIALQPRPIRALYLTYYGVGSDELLGNAVKLIESTETNALVIDIKGDRGWLAYQSRIPMVQQVGAQQQIMIPNVEEFVREMKQRGIYLIARIVVFKDNPLARTRPDLGVKDSRTGGLWIDREGLAWTDPFKEEVWDYNVAIAKEAAEFGFDEIQFDYIRFPTDAGAGTSVDAVAVSQPKTMENRVRAISGFLQRARQALEPTGATLAVDVFGYVCWRTDDMGIGQNLETIARYVDVISPMVYPTLYWDGIPVADGPTFSDDAAAHPYEIVYESLKRASERLKAAGSAAQLRPWLQYYNDYTLDIPYGDREVRVQKQATSDNDITGWMLWDPSNTYRKGGFDPKPSS